MHGGGNFPDNLQPIIGVRRPDVWVRGEQRRRADHKLAHAGFLCRLTGLFNRPHMAAATADMLLYSPSALLIPDLILYPPSAVLIVRLHARFSFAHD